VTEPLQGRTGSAASASHGASDVVSAAPETVASISPFSAKGAAAMALGIFEVLPAFVNRVTNAAIMEPLDGAFRVAGSGVPFRFRTENNVSGLLTGDPAFLAAARSAQSGAEVGALTATGVDAAVVGVVSAARAAGAVRQTWQATGGSIRGMASLAQRRVFTAIDEAPFIGTLGTRPFVLRAAAERDPALREDAYTHAFEVTGLMAAGHAGVALVGVNAATSEDPERTPLSMAVEVAFAAANATIAYREAALAVRCWRGATIAEREVEALSATATLSRARGPAPRGRTLAEFQPTVKQFVEGTVFTGAANALFGWSYHTFWKS
jgi:hypothetical protein